MDPGKTPQTSDTQPKWDAKYHFDALSGRVQGQIREVQNTMAQLLAKFEEFSTVTVQTPPQANNPQPAPTNQEDEFERHEEESESEHFEDERVEDNTARVFPLRRDRNGFAARGRGRGRGDQFQPRFQAARRNVYPEQNRYGNADGLLSNIKTTIPEFEGKHDPDAYLDWERKVDKIFECYDFTEVKKVQLASMEFTGYAADWWENIQGRRRRQ